MTANYAEIKELREYIEVYVDKKVALQEEMSLCRIISHMSKYHLREFQIIVTEEFLDILRKSGHNLLPIDYKIDQTITCFIKE